MARGRSVQKQEESQSVSASTEGSRPTDNIIAALKDPGVIPKKILRQSHSQDSEGEQEKGKKRQHAKKSESLNNGHKWPCSSCRFLNVASTDQCIICTRWRPQLPKQVLFCSYQ